MKTKQVRVWVLVLISSLIALTLHGFVVFAQEPQTGQGEADTTPSVTKTPTPETEKFSVTPLMLGDAIPLKAGRGVVLNEIEGASGQATYIVQLAAPPVASYQGGILGLAPTNPAIRGETKLDATNSATIAYLNHLENRQAQFLTAAERTVGHSVGVVFDYQFAFNGVALRLTPQEAVRIAKLPGVRQVQRDFQRQLLTDFGPDWIGAPNIWDGSGTGGLPGTQGEGIIIGVIDSGINMDHPSFADIGQDGYDHNNPFGSGNYVGWCDPGNPAYDPSLNCNDKLIGVWDFVDAISTENDGPEDGDGHGSHTASTAAGNVVISTTATLAAPTYVYTATISGVAPHANIITYDVCAGGCPGSALVAAIDQTVSDGVDVINFSIGGGSSNPWNDSDSLAFLGAFEAGIIPVSSAGNNGPNPETVGSPAEAPWILAVGASTHDRTFVNTLINMSGGATSPLADMQGKSITSGYGPAPIVYAGDIGDPLCLNPFSSATWSGEIVVCDRGQIARVQKGANVQAGGAGGFVLVNDVDNGDSLNADPHVLPGVHLTYDNGVILKDWLAVGSGHTATISGTTIEIDPQNGDVMGAFSSRGANRAVPDVIKPDVTAPGLDIFAAYRNGVEFSLLSGTSMSSPHTAGSAALLRALHPGWSVAEIKSALMTTAWTDTVLKEDGSTPADPFDMGAGRLDLSKAGQAGLVMDVTKAEFDMANPSLSGDPKTLNLPSMADSHCYQLCSWTRTFRSTLARPSTWDISTEVADPGMGIDVSTNQVTVAAGDNFDLTVEVDVTALAPETWHFGTIVLSEMSGAAPDAHLPIAVFTSSATDLQVFSKDVSRDTATLGTTLTYTLNVQNLDFVTRSYSLTDNIPLEASYVPETAFASVGTPSVSGNILTWAHSLSGGLGITASPSPSGYVSLNSLGVSPSGCPDLDCDDTGWIITLPGTGFDYLGNHYDRITWVTNGYIYVGTPGSTTFVNQNMPDPGDPNGVIAPLWTDLDLDGGDGVGEGTWYVASVTDGVGKNYYVFEWEDVDLWDTPGSNLTFQIWIREGSDDIWFVYEDLTGLDPSNLTIGFEDETGTIGQSYFYNTTGTGPVVGTDLHLAPTFGASATVTFAAELTSGDPEIVVLNEADLQYDGIIQTAWASTVILTDTAGSPPAGPIYFPVILKQAP